MVVAVLLLRDDVDLATVLSWSCSRTDQQAEALVFVCDAWSEVARASVRLECTRTIVTSEACRAAPNVVLERAVDAVSHMSRTTDRSPGIGLEQHV